MASDGLAGLVTLLTGEREQASAGAAKTGHRSVQSVTHVEPPDGPVSPPFPSDSEVQLPTCGSVSVSHFACFQQMVKRTLGSLLLS